MTFCLHLHAIKCVNSYMYYAKLKSCGIYIVEDSIGRVEF